MAQRQPFWTLAALLLVMLLALIACTPPCYPPDTVLIVRHAEKAPDGQIDPDKGVSRAQVLKEIAVDAGVDTIYTTSICRTAQTAQPAADALDLRLNVVWIGNGLDNCDPIIEVPTKLLEGITEVTELADYVYDEPETDKEELNKVVLIVVHSPDVPKLIQAFGVECEDLESPKIEDGTYNNGCYVGGDFHHLFKLTFPNPGYFRCELPSLSYQAYGAQPDGGVE